MLQMMIHRGSVERAPSVEGQNPTGRIMHSFPPTSVETDLEVSFRTKELFLDVL
jgi:hypothetical protein